jgi:outer membrane immunogenic protein
LLIYGTGGLAVTNLEYFNSYQSTTIFTLSTESASVSKTKAGWTVGGGFELALNRNWSINAEYLFADFGNVDTPRARVINSVFGPLNTVYDHSADLRTSVVRAGINYRFDYGPVAAKF